MEVFDWIKQFYKTRDQNSWTKIEDFIPDVFDCYFELHWDIGIIDDFPFDEFPEKNETIEETNARIKIEKKFNLFSNQRKESLYRQISLSELAERFNLPYSRKIIYQIKDTPGVSILEKSSNLNLKESIERLSKGQNLNLFVEDISRWPFDENPKQEYKNISLEEYFKLQNSFSFDFGTFLFPTSID